MNLYAFTSILHEKKKCDFIKNSIPMFAHSYNQQESRSLDGLGVVFQVLMPEDSGSNPEAGSIYSFDEVCPGLGLLQLHCTVEPQQVVKGVAYHSLRKKCRLHVFSECSNLRSNKQTNYAPKRNKIRLNLASSANLNLQAENREGHCIVRS